MFFFQFSLLKHAVSPLRQRHPLEDQDPNSQDSGYGAFLDKDEAKSGFRFAEPSGLAPRKFSIEQSPRKENSPLKSPRSKSRGHLNPPLFHSLSSGSESADDGFTDLLDLEKVEDGVHLPSGISSLLSGPIIRDHTTILKQNVSPKEERPRSSFQRSQSLIENHTPSSSKVTFYPYEFDGGHIKGAKNIYTKEQIFKEFVDIKPAKTTETTQNSETNSSKRNILIFHCEFSSERGPNMFRFLRKTDRDQNGDSYPALNYPELYLLHGGYKTFFEKHSDKCEPCAYRPMLDPNHETDLRHFRSKSKSWNGDSKSRQAFRNTLKRLGL
ncbi:hypothetical protein C0J52_17642 [Blattella germanica]|nr:hypothetical protein C0J52_17642 [Blattella germanica]